MTLKLIAELKVERTMRARFMSGKLPNEWREKYPDIFDEDDLRLALSQPTYHFYEWVSAKFLFEERGYISLLEKYQFANHKRKRSVVQNLRFEGLQTALAYRDPLSNHQAPDLLVYRPDYSDWFFCEVKGGEDSFRNGQLRYFEKLSELSGKPICWLKVRSF